MQDLLDHEDDDVEDVFCLTFEFSYTNIYGETVHVDLKQRGSKIPVTKENKWEFILANICHWEHFAQFYVMNVNMN